MKYKDKIKDILDNAQKYHQAYYQANTFRGPSLYFHLRALETRESEEITKHLEYVYATLSAWGMHRMGTGGSKMQTFNLFKRSIEQLHDKIKKAQDYDFRKIDDNKWNDLKEIFKNINIMASNTRIVGNSKVMHHMIPNIVPPIDREYTLRFLRGNTNITNDMEHEWQLMRDIIEDFFIPVASNVAFQAKATDWMTRQNDYPWDTSILKIVDNLIIGSRKI